jgi:hypothetical protein
VRGAGREQRRLVGEVAVDGRAAYAGVLGQRADPGLIERFGLRAPADTA